MKIGHLPDGARGFDANQHISAGMARAAVSWGYQFAVRYVRRAPVNPQDFTAGELATLLEAGLGVMAVQHVADENHWRPTPTLGAAYGTVAASECQKIGLPRGVTVWCDLEGVAPGTTTADVIAYCNQWHDRVAEGGFEPGLYVGWHAGLTGQELYQRLRFARYWSGYNLDLDKQPVVRGVCMRQFTAKPAGLIPGLTVQTMDVDVLRADALGGRPTLVLPHDPG
jgi:hypothetical protein